MTKEQVEEIKKIGVPSEELYQEVCNELLDYKQLEKGLGCPLEVIFKALALGVYYEDAAFMVPDLRRDLDGEFVLYSYKIKYLLTKNYKKTWWLKEDRSE